jgi:hypothetical protein
MSIVKLDPPETPVLTRDIAKQFMDMRKLPGERPKKTARLKYFLNLLIDGDFGSPVWSKAIVGDDPRPWRADGQHTSTVLATCPDDFFPKELRVTIFTFHLDEMSERGKLFDRFDHPKSARSNSDKLGMYMADFQELSHLDHSIVGKALRGIAYFNSAMMTKKADISPEVWFIPAARDQGLYLHNPVNRNFCIWMAGWQKAKHNEFISKPGITAEMYSDWKDYPKLANKFWDEVLTESNPDANDYTRDLASTLHDWCVKKPVKSPDKFRDKAKLVWERWRRMKGAPDETESETPIPQTPLPMPLSSQIEAQL